MRRKSLSGISVLVTLLILAFSAHSMWQSHVEDTAIAQVAQGDKLMTAGDPASLQSAVDCYKKALVILDGMHYEKEARNQGITNYNMARAYAALKQYPSAIESARRALPFLAGSETKVDLADTYNNLGLYYLKTEQPDQAMDAYQHAEPLYRAAGQAARADDMVGVEGAVLYDKVGAAARKGDWTGARDTCLLSQQRYHLAHQASGEAEAVHKLGLIYKVLHNTSAAADAERQEKALRASLPKAAR